MSYKAIISKLEIKPHGNADKLEIATAFNTEFVVGKDDFVTGDLAIVFLTDGQLDDEYCKQNCLYPVYGEDGKKIGGGFFDPKNRRVRAQGFRGVKSYGYVARIYSVEYTGYDTSKLKEGDSFDELNGHKICNKYETKATRAFKGEKSLHRRRETEMLRMHPDTEQLKYYIDKITKGSILQVSLKLHGTSGRTGFVLDEKPKISEVKILFCSVNCNLIVEGTLSIL